MKRIAMDFDETLTAAPLLFKKFVSDVREFGWDIILVTARRDTFENNETVNQFLDEWDIDLPVYFTSLQSKVDYMKQIGVEVDIWIDDDPKRCALGH